MISGSPLRPDVLKAIRDAKIPVLGQDDIKNEPHAMAVAAVVRAFGDSTAGFIYIEPCTARSTRRPPDIVLCHLECGVVVFEVKGYPVGQIESVEAGSFKIRQGGLVRPINPFRQAEAAMFDIKDQVQRLASRSDLPCPRFNYLVVLPNITRAEFEVAGLTPHLPSQWLLLRDDLDPSNLRARVKKFADGGLTLTVQQAAVVRQAFGDSAAINPPRPSRPDISESTLGADIDETVVLEKYLSKEQSELSRLPVEGFPRLIRGVAGSGKTVVLANMVARLLNRQQNRAPQLFDDFEDNHLKIAVVCFNRALVPFLREKIRDAYMQQTFEALPKSDVLFVGHLNSLLRKLTYNNRTTVNYIPVKEVPDPAARAVSYARQLATLSTQQPEVFSHLLYDAIFIDEGQDFVPEEYKLLLTLLRPDPRTGEKDLVIFYDDAQNLYARPRFNWKQLGIDVQRGDRARVMKECFRNTRQIVETAFNVLLGTQASSHTKLGLREFADVGYLSQAGLITKQQNGLYRVDFAERTGLSPIVKLFASRTEEKAWLASEVERLVCREKVRPEDILILFGGSEQFEDLERVIRTHVNQDQLEGFVRPYGGRPECDQYIFRERHLTLSTVYGAKGYDAQVVYLVGADLFGTDAKSRAAFYVGATRAKLLLFVSGIDRHAELVRELEDVLKARA